MDEDAVARPSSGRQSSRSVSYRALLVGAALTHDPAALDNPLERGGKSFRLLKLCAGYTVSLSMHVRPADLKRELNDKFRERFPDIQLTLSKLRSIKADLVAFGIAADLPEATVATAHIYFERLVMREKINKENRKIMAGACLTLALKFMESNDPNTPLVFKTIEERWKITKAVICSHEFDAFADLEFEIKPDLETLTVYCHRVAKIMAPER